MGGRYGVFHSSGPTETFKFGKAITRFRVADLTLKLVQSATAGILMPTKSLFWSLNKLQLTSYANVEQEVGAVRVQYESLYHSNSSIEEEFGAMTVEDTLDMIIDAFVRVTPMPVKSGDMVFLCNCDCFREYACEHSGVLRVLSMLWNPKLSFPDIERAEQLKVKETKKASTPFDAAAKQEKKEKDGEQRAKDNARVKWNPAIPECYAPLVDSSAGMTAQGGKINALAIRFECLYFAS
jgi:hypothetical protein